MSSLWTPEGEHPVGERRPGPAKPPPKPTPPGPPRPPGSDQPAPRRGVSPSEDAAAAIDDLRRQLVDSPPDVVVANHAYGIFELAAIYLSQDPPLLPAARLAIDAMGCLVDGLAGRLGENESSLRDALAQIRLAFVQLEGAGRPATADGNGTGGGDDPGVGA